jgi:hypothetical protein
MPAIHPLDKLVQAKTIPTFTKAEVEAYLVCDAVAIDVTAQKIPHTITFLPSQQVGQMLKADFSKSAPILCYVEFKGSSLLQ